MNLLTRILALFRRRKVRERHPVRPQWLTGPVGLPRIDEPVEQTIFTFSEPIAPPEPLQTPYVPLETVTRRRKKRKRANFMPVYTRDEYRKMRRRLQSEGRKNSRPNPK